MPGIGGGAGGGFGFSVISNKRNSRGHQEKHDFDGERDRRDLEAADELRKARPVRDRSS